MPSLPLLTSLLPNLSQFITVAAFVAALILLGWRVARALRKKPGPVRSEDLAKPLTDPNSPTEVPVGPTRTPPDTPDSEVTSTPVAVRAIEQTAIPAPVPHGNTPTNAGVATVDGVEFVRLEPHHLKKLRIVAQAADNQWESRRLLEHMRWSFSKGKPLGLEQIRPLRYEAGRSEYIRALLNAEQLVINRAFMYNTDYLAQDYITPGEEREALKELMASGVLVPFLIRENSPAEKARDVDVVSVAQAEWDRLCRETRAQAARLSWDDETNFAETQRLFAAFTLWLNNLGVLSAYADPVRLAAELGLPTDSETVRTMERRFREVAHWAIDTVERGESVYRGGFYQKFILADGPNVKVADGIIDFSKPFAAELKQIADLSYATNLPDAIGGFSLTPMDSLPRTALQELTFRAGSALQPISPAEIRQLLQREAFALIQGGQFLKSMSYLTLRDVIALRATDEWMRYTDAMNDLLDHPLDFQDKAQTVYTRYMDLARQMTNRVAPRIGENLQERWQPVLKLVLTFGASAVTFEWHPLGNLGAGGSILYSVVEGAINQGATMTARMIIGGVAARRAEAQLETSLDFMRRSLADARGTFRDLTDWLARQPGYQNITGQRDTSQDETDPNINTPD